MGKLTGKAKADFLARINKGRIKAGLKRISSKTKRIASKKSGPKTRKPSKRATIRKPNKVNRPKSNVAKGKGKGKTSRKALTMQKIKQGAIGGVSGTATTAIMKRLGANGLADDLGYIVASLVGKTPGVVGTAVIKQGLQRFGGSLSGFLGSGNGNGNGVQNTGGFA